MRDARPDTPLSTRLVTNGFKIQGRPVSGEYLCSHGLGENVGHVLFGSNVFPDEEVPGVDVFQSPVLCRVLSYLDTAHAVGSKRGD